MDKTIEQQIEDIKNKIKTLGQHEAFIVSVPQISEWDRKHVVDACGRIKRKMEKELKALLIEKINSGNY